jgi:hypothetical protein
LLSVLTPLSATEIQAGVDDLLATTALPFDIVFEKFNDPAAFQALNLKHILWLPKPRILSRTFHGSLLL